MDDPSWLEKTRGYVELGMLDEAWRELESLSPKQLARPQSLELKITILLDRDDLEEAWAVCQNLAASHPANHAGFVQGAFCLHALDDTAGAIAHLQSGPESLRDEPVYYYNLACYELALGRGQAACTWLLRSFEMDESFRKRALEDPDLSDLHEDISNFDD